MQLAICRDDFAAFDEFDLIADSVGGVLGYSWGCVIRCMCTT